MIAKVKKIDYEKIKAILNEYDNESFYEKVNYIPHSSDLYKELKTYINPEDFGNKSVLGIDIYRYSSYNLLEQTLIPFIFKVLFEATIKMCIESNQFIFQSFTKEKIEKCFLSTGDGGFLILDTPLHSLIFAINFEFAVRSYNAFHLFPKLRKIIGPISLRYAITYNNVYYFDNSFYGRAIINNARILNKDNLNRCLIDQETNEWFMIHIDGIENLQVITINEVANIFDFQSYNRKFIDSGNNLIFGKDVSRTKGILNSDILKIGQIQSKDTSLDIYNIHLQVVMEVSDHKDKTKNRIITVSLGNLNTSGI